MKKSILKKHAWAFLVLALATTTAFGQGWRNGNRNVGQTNVTCLNTISGLTDEQKTQIAAMDEKHREMMDELRTKRRSTTDAVEKSEIRTTMLKGVEAHRNAVKALLNDDQKKQYEQLHASAGYGPNQNMGNGRGKTAFRGCGQGNGCVYQGNGPSNRQWDRNGRGTCRNWK